MRIISEVYTSRQQLPSPLWGGVRGGGRAVFVVSASAHALCLRASADSLHNAHDLRGHVIGRFQRGQVAGLGENAQG